jgi:hypothetical protein
MKGAACIFLGTIMLVMSAHQLPAPISEIPEPTPTVAPKQKQATRSKPKSAPAEAIPTANIRTQPVVIQNRFAGTWKGTMHWGVAGTVDVTLVIDPQATTVNEINRVISGVRTLKNNGQTVSWHEGGYGAMSWTFTPNPDGKTAVVTLKELMFINDSAVFQKQ